MYSKKSLAKNRQPKISNPPRRANLAWRHATELDLEAFYFSQTISHWRRLRDLSPLGNRILRAFCALHRASHSGFTGTSCCQEALAKFVERVTEERCKLRTLQRGISEVIQKGYLEKSRPKGRKRVCTYTLTEKSTSIWSQDSLHTPKRRTMDRTKTERKSQAYAEIFSQTLSSQDPRSTLSCDLKIKDKPHKSKKSRTQKTIVYSLLAFLKRLSKKEGRKGRVAIGRAALELAKDPRALAEPSGVDWSYWLRRWSSMTYPEKQYAARMEILPQLCKSSAKLSESTSRLSQDNPKPVALPKAQPSKEDCMRMLQGFIDRKWDYETVAACAARLGIENWPDVSGKI